MGFLSSNFEPFHQLLISIGLGLLVGLQREWAESPLAGIRSFALICVLGTVAGILSEQFGLWIIAVGLVGVLGIMLVGKISIMRDIETNKQHGIVSELSALLVYFIGVIVYSGPVLLAASLAGLLAVVLQFKLELHTFVFKFDKDEIRSIMQFVLIALVIFPIIPNKSFGPYDVINPHNIWTVVILVIGISMIGYIIHKFYGKKAGVLLNGFLGGLISSTATTMTSSRNSKKFINTAPYNAIIILLSWTVLYLRLFIELAVTAPGYRVAYLPLLIMTLVSLFPIMWLWRKARKYSGVELHNNPTQLKLALSFSILYTLILLATSYFKAEYGKDGLTIMALISGMLNVDVVTLSTGRLVIKGGLDPNEGYFVIFTAIFSNNFVKGIIIFFLGGKQLFKVVLIPWLITLVASGLLLFY